MLTAFIENDTLFIYFNGFYRYSETTTQLRNPSVQVNGNTVRLIGTSFGGARQCYAWDYDENGNFLGVRSEYL